jgi:hypothetical protein
MQKFSIKQLHTEFNNTFKISYTMIKLDSLQKCKEVSMQTDKCIKTESRTKIIISVDAE